MIKYPLYLEKEKKEEKSVKENQKVIIISPVIALIKGKLTKSFEPAEEILVVKEGREHK